MEHGSLDPRDGRGSLQSMPRVKSFWKEKLRAAEERLARNLATIQSKEFDLRRQQKRLDVMKQRKHAQGLRYRVRCRIEALTSAIARLERANRMLVMTKIPYYEERLSVEDKTIWERVREDSLRL